MNRKFVNKFSNFVLGNGFYIALTLCVALIVLSGYYLMDSLSPAPTSTVAPVSGVPEILVPEVADTPVVVPEVTLPVVTPEPVLPVILPDMVEEESEPEVEELPQELEEDPLSTELEEAKTMSFSWPALGEVRQEHSMEVLSYNAVMGDWRTHNGLDIVGDVGSEVMSVADGVVTAVFQDQMMGTTVVIDHGEGVESTYANLGEFPSVSANDWVTEGQIIAVVGDTALAESGTEPHLQFSMTKEGEAVDPKEFLPEK